MEVVDYSASVDASFSYDSIARRRYNYLSADSIDWGQFDSEKSKMTRLSSGLAARIWQSIFQRSVIPGNDDERRWVVANTLVLHLRPVQVPASTLRYTHTFGLGGMSMVLVMMLIATGLLMMFAYEPSPERAYQSIVSMQQEILFGRLIRACTTGVPTC